MAVLTSSTRSRQLAKNLQYILKVFCYTTHAMNILLIEDDTEILAFLREAFRGEGFVVDTAGDGLVGSQKARMNDYDMIILDNCLPYKNGKISAPNSERSKRIHASLCSLLLKI